jgi:uncharacterized protein YndB with AHSA1/START domain
MVTPAASLTFTRTVKAPPTEIFRLFASPAGMLVWLCHAAEVDPCPSGRLYLWWHQGYYTAGVFTAVRPPQQLAFTWQGPGDPAATRVSVDLVPSGSSERTNLASTDVTLMHSGLGMDSAWAGAAANIRHGWEAALENLQAVVETGVDLRLAHEPEFGLGEADSVGALRAAALGVPVTEGLWIGGVLEGLAAHAAGLRRDDVLVELDGRPITTWPSLNPVLAAHRPGDRIEAVFYRGAAQQRVRVELARRPSPPPEPPASAQAMAEAARAAHAALDMEVDAVFAGVGDAAADVRPAPEAWTAKQVVAHLIATERDLQSWITALIEEGSLLPAFHANEWTRLSALVATYPTLTELLAELKRSQAATVTMLATLPPAVASRKYLLYALALWLPGFPEHVREHLVELRQLLTREHK